MPIHDRIKELRRVPASSLRGNPRNWRAHPREQQRALRGLLREVGYAGALLARELPDGGLELIDGHLRASTTPNQLVPVLVLDVTEAEAATLLATHDPLAAMAEADLPKLEDLLKEISSGEKAVNDLLADLAKQAGIHDPDEAAINVDAKAEAVALPRVRQVLADCRDEAEQKQVHDWLKERGIRCRVLTLS
ncbi:MAG: hypothetical protein NTW19_15430 [Planctomycetota bacterium]|nr:hypothetical protein [Planctomycetota bacterium]